MLEGNLNQILKSKHRWFKILFQISIRIRTGVQPTRVDGWRSVYVHRGGRGSGRVMCLPSCVCLCILLLYRVAKSCPTLCDPMNCSPLGSSLHGVFQARILQQVAISFFRGSSPPWDRTCVSWIGRQVCYHWRHQGNLSVYWWQI